MRSTAIVMAPLCTMVGGGRRKERGCLGKKIKFSLFNQGYLNEFLTIYPCCGFMISLQDWWGGGQWSGGVNMWTESWRLSGGWGHHTWRHKGIFLFYKELKEQQAAFWTTDAFSSAGSHEFTSQNPFKVRAFILKCCILRFPLIVSHCMEIPGLRVMGACSDILCRLRPSVFVCPVGSFVAEAVRAPPPPPGLRSWCALICRYTRFVISVYACSACRGEILTLRAALVALNRSRAFPYQVSELKANRINAFAPHWCDNSAPLGRRLRGETLKMESTKWAVWWWSWPSHFDVHAAQIYWLAL